MGCENKWLQPEKRNPGKLAIWWLLAVTYELCDIGISDSQILHPHIPCVYHGIYQQYAGQEVNLSFTDRMPLNFDLIEPSTRIYQQMYRSYI